MFEACRQRSFLARIKLSSYDPEQRSAELLSLFALVRITHLTRFDRAGPVTGPTTIEHLLCYARRTRAIQRCCSISQRTCVRVAGRAAAHVPLPRITMSKSRL